MSIILCVVGVGLFMMMFHFLFDEREERGRTPEERMSAAERAEEREYCQLVFVLVGIYCAAFLPILLQVRGVMGDVMIRYAMPALGIVSLLGMVWILGTWIYSELKDIFVERKELEKILERQRQGEKLDDLEKEEEKEMTK